MKDLLKSYRKRLINLTGKNRSLLLLRLASQQLIDVHEANFLNGGTSFSILEKLISGKKVMICEEHDARDESVNVLSLKLKRLIRADKFIYEEQGSKDLHIGWPFIKGKFSDGTPVRCALAYIPVELTLKEGKFTLSKRPNQNIVFNISLLLAYGHYNQVNIPNELLEYDLDDLDTDITVFRSNLYQILKDSPLDVHFNQDNFMDVLKTFHEYKKEDFLQNHKSGELKLFPEAVLGIFPQAGSNLLPDYDFMINGRSFETLDDFFSDKTLISDKDHSSYFYDAQISEEKTLTPFQLDAYQEEAIKSVKKGYSLVVQGPPGTGKSQLICNLVADFVARGKNVLVVSQKRAALDVVFNRLSEKYLQDFVGLVHDFQNDRTTLYEKIAHQIKKIPSYENENNSLDLVQLERRFLQLSRRIDQLIEFFEEYKFALYDTSECGMSAKELYLRSNPRKEIIHLRQVYQHTRIDQLPEFLVKLRDFVHYGHVFEKQDYPLHERNSFSGYGLSELKKMEEILIDIPDFRQKINLHSQDIIDHPLEVEDAELILRRRGKIIEMLNLLADSNIFEYFKNILPYPDKSTDLLWLNNTERVLMECYKGEGPEMSLPSDQLGKFQEVLTRVLEARKRITKFLKWKLFSEDKYFLKRVLVANNLKNTKEGISILVERVDNRLNLEHNISKLKEIGWFTNIPNTAEKASFQNWFHAIKTALKAKLIFTSLRNFRDFFPPQKITYSQLKSGLERLFTVIHEIPERRQIWELYFSKTQISNLLKNSDLCQLYLDTLRRDFDSLCDFDDLKNGLKDFEKETMKMVIDETGKSSPEDQEKLFINSLYLAWINHIEAKYPVLRAVSSRKYQSMEKEFQQAIEEKTAISDQILLLKIKERTYEELEFNRLNNRITYRDLEHQVTKKRRLWPLRRTISEYSEELFKLMPCWLASPESVSALFPLEKFFDLVIFDEASQCFVERGLPSIYRGKQIVIAGDSKQLRPNDLYTIRYEEDTDEDPALEISSILDLADRHLQSVQLQGHYRSQTLDLIEFSNHEFYEGKLVLLPNRNLLNQKSPAIKYIKVEGIWEKNTNRAEAEHIRDLVMKHIENSSDQSIGIVTFNVHQQQLIHDLIDEAASEQNLLLPNDLIIKNIENIQGDERDIIIFSVGYAPDKAGRMAMQFGSLNAEFGENRLNVAITRARQRIFIISSILPHQLKVEEAKNPGPKLLKSYLEYCWKISEELFQPKLPSQIENKEWYLQHILKEEINRRNLPFTVAADMPFADLTIKNNDEYLGLIQLDDDQYFRSPSVKDAHVYKPFLLQNKEWSSVQVSSRNYWQDPDLTIDGLVTFISNQVKK